ncbi:MAG: hydroxyphenylacetyl-CoA thioesterase PaaI [Gammaproteobacteria bacterium]|nr:hydroxyphenylacetyl-CoA thioesterase PaaI [Gammaproteobacteria bacterium]MCP5425676.1 hydroxyphenylacetyl-CoA thioesterase PaaI [Gammaproteobacteria bacterium]MCP5459707.1 hydroxyphenylacetyl-CoA thioesterase PaaI [Gammaproteobacteria bacterium]
MVENSAAVAQKKLAETCSAILYERDYAAQMLGIVLDEVGPGYARMHMNVRKDMVNGHDICHGGIIFTLADTTFAYSCNSRNLVTVASGCSIDFVNPGQLGDCLTAVAHERSLSGRTGIYDITVTNQNDTVIAHFRGRSHRIQGQVVPGLEIEL